MFLQQPWCSEELIERARRRAGLQDFGDTQFQEGLRVFVGACAEDADLSLFGRLGTRWDIGRLLSNLLRLRDEELKSPGIFDEPIVRPIFITGLPRSGTTFLHQLLTADEGNLVPRVWQLIHPYPTRLDQAGADRRRLRVARQLRMFQLLSPRFRQMHPIDADSPQECSEITAHIFASPRFDTTYNVPNYRRWLDGMGHLGALHFHKRFLQHLQHQSGRPKRWILKCPDHVFALAEIRSVYPDARFVFVHRDPLRVMASVARLTEVLRRPFTRHIDRVALGHQECERWALGAELMVRTAEAEPFAEPIFHLHYNDLVGDPVASVEKLYRHFGLTLAPSVASNIARIIKANPNGGYGANRYRFDEYGIDANQVRERFACYMARFGSSAEPERARRGLPLITPSTELSTEPAD